MEPSSRYLVGEPRRHHNADTGHLSCPGLLPTRDAGFFVPTHPGGCDQSRHWLRADVYCLWVGIVRNLILLLLPILSAAPGQ